MCVVYPFSFTKFGISCNGNINVNNAQINTYQYAQSNMYILDKEIKAEIFHATIPEFTLFLKKIGGN